MHKHNPHHDIIVAYLEGKTVQILRGDTWCDVQDYAQAGMMPAFYHDSTYRIKPEVKPNIIKQMVLHLEPVGTKGHKVICREREHWEHGDIQLEFDGNTMKLVSAKVFQ